MLASPWKIKLARKRKRSGEIRGDPENYGKKEKVLVTAITFFEMNKRIRTLKYHIFCY